MTRFFFAVTPPEPVLSRIEAFRGRWGHPHHNVEPHITVKIPFPLSEEPAPMLDAVRSACAGIAPFAVRLDAPARFPGNQVLYLTVQAEEQLAQLHLAVVRALGPWAPLDPRGHEGESYTPHLTLAVGRFGIDAAGLDEMERLAREELTNEPFTCRSLRGYRRDGKEDRWQPFIDLPLG